MPPLPHELQRTLVIRAPRDVVFRYFTDSAHWAAWWGPGSTIDPVPGGRVYIRHPNGVEISGDVIEARAPEHIVFTYGFETGQPIAPGASRVTIRLEPAGPFGRDTRLTLTHAFADITPRDLHVQGWRYQLSVFSNVVSNEIHANAAAVVASWFAAWNATDEAVRASHLEIAATPTVQFSNRYSVTNGRDELLAQITAAQRFMPGRTLQITSAVRQCQGTALADWTVTGPDGSPQESGTSVFTLASDGRIDAAVGVGR